MRDLIIDEADVAASPLEKNPFAISVKEKKKLTQSTKSIKVD